MFVPKKVNFRKCHLSEVPKKATSNYLLSKGVYGIKLQKGTKITSNQLETIRKDASKSLNREGKIFISVFPNTPYTKKSLGTRMGGGAGSLDHWSVSVPAGTIIMEMSNIKEEQALAVLNLVKYKINGGLSLAKRKFIYTNN